MYEYYGLLEVRMDILGLQEALRDVLISANNCLLILASKITHIASLKP